MSWSAADAGAGPRLPPAQGRGAGDEMNAATRLPDLDALRGVAILLAMGWHINQTPTGVLAVDLLLWPGATFGWAGVDLFFVLSGFLVGGLIFREVRQTGTLDLRRFYIRRILRLWPVLYLFLIAMALSGQVPLSDFFWQIALHVQNYVEIGSARHTWSLAVEEHFYVLFSLVTVWLLARPAGLRRMPHVLVGTLLLCLALRIAGAWAGADAVALQTRTHYRLDSLSLGVLLAHVSVYRPDVFSRLLDRQALNWALLGLGLVFISVVPKSTVLGSTVGYSIAAVLSASALLLCLRLRLSQRAPRLIGVFGFLGLISYPLYLWHVPVMRVIEGLDAPSRLVAVPVMYLASVVVSYALTKAVERPMIAWRNRLLPSTSAPGGFSGPDPEPDPTATTGAGRYHARLNRHRASNRT
jgi:peptidoglycan/LPS O-acetylase OafA/YrhL